MLELVVVETLIGLFLFMHIIRPYIKAFWRTRGFVFFPPAALLCCAAMIPAYGVRPECFPLYAGTLIYTIAYFPSVISTISGLKSYEVRTGSIFTSLLSVVFLAFSLAAAFRFLPEERFENMPENVGGGARYTVISTAALPAKEFELHDTARDISLFLSYYGGEGKDLILLIPPLSFPAADDMRAALVKCGYSVLTFTRPGFDREAKDSSGVFHTVSFPKKAQYFMLLLSGIKNEKQNAAQRLLAGERAADIRFILGELQKDGPLKTAAGVYDGLFLLGYGAGGAAAVEVAGDRSALDAYPELKAAAAIESIFLCDFEKPRAVENVMDEAKGFFWLRNRLYAFFSRPVLQLTNIAHPEIPVLFIAGDRAQAKKKKERYIAVVQTMLESPAPFFFASVDGAHEIDFSSFASMYPVAPLFLKSSLPREETENAWPREEITARSAEYISTFFKRVKEKDSVSALKAALESAAGNTSAVLLQTSELK